MKKVAVFGMGYVGCVTACCLSQDGHQVIGVDVDPGKVAEINAGSSPITEPGLDELIESQTRAGRLQATTDPERAVHESDMALIAVGTPSSEDGSMWTMRPLSASCNPLACIRSETRPYWVVIRSTLLPGILRTTSALRYSNIRPANRFGSDLKLCNDPEFLPQTSRSGTIITRPTFWWERLMKKLPVPCLAYTIQCKPINASPTRGLPHL